MLFDKSKVKLASLADLQEFKDEISKIQKPKHASSGTVNVAFKDYYDYLFMVVGKLNVFLTKPGSEELLKKTGLSKTIISDLMFWSGLNGKNPASVSDEIYFMGRSLKFISDMANYSKSSEEARIFGLEAALNIKKKTKKISELIASICDTMSDYLYQTIKKTEEEITKYINGQPKIKTNLFGLLKIGKEK